MEISSQAPEGTAYQCPICGAEGRSLPTFKDAPCPSCGFQYLPPLPPLLIDMIRTGRWVHPGDEVMLQKVPFIRDPLEFLGCENSPIRQLSLMGPQESENAFLSEYRGTIVGERSLPWIDVELAMFVMCNRLPGDDVGVALDYRGGGSPRVIGGDWSLGNKCIYREISPSFEAFVELLGL